MVATTKTVKDIINEIHYRINLIDRQLADLEKNTAKYDTCVSDVQEKLDKLKDDVRYHKDIPEIQKSLNKLEEQLDSIRLELPEMRLIKKIVMTLIAFILTAFLGLVWNMAVNKPQQSSESIDVISKKLLEEYRKTEQKK